MLWAHWRTNIYIVKINPYTWAIKCLHFHINLYRSRADYTYDFAAVEAAVAASFFAAASPEWIHSVYPLYSTRHRLAPSIANNNNNTATNEIMLWRIRWMVRFDIFVRTPFVFDFAVRRSYASFRFDAKLLEHKRHSRHTHTHQEKKMREKPATSIEEREEKNGNKCFVPPLVCKSHEPCSV